MTAFKDWLNGLTSKTTPVDADEVYVRDSSGTPSSKKLTWANLKATLANTFLSLTGGTVAGGERTTSGSTLTITETLNNAGVTFPGALVIDQTRTAAANLSPIADFKVGGTSKMRVLKDGGIALGSSSSPPDYGGINYSTDGTGGFLLGAYGSYGMHMGSACVVGWGSGAPGEKDLILVRDAAGTLAQRNGTNAQTFRLYNTYTDASNYERGFMRWNSNVLEIGAEAAGTGVLRKVKLFMGGSQIDVSTSNHMSFQVSGVTNHFAIDANSGVKVLSARGYGWSSTTDATASADTMLSRPAAKIIQPNDASGGGAAFEFIEMTAPAAPATNGARIYAEDNGSGKTRLMALFATGAAVQIAIEP